MSMRTAIEIVNNRLAQVVTLRASERNSYSLEYYKQSGESEEDLRKGLIDASDFERFNTMLLEQRSEKLAEIDAKYELTIEVLDAILADFNKLNTRVGI